MSFEFEYYPDGSFHFERYFIIEKDQKILHRFEEPAVIERYPDGTLKREEWWKRGDRSRFDNLPAIIDYFPSGRKNREEWWKFGNLSNGGYYLPVIIEYFDDEKGTIAREVFTHFRRTIPREIHYFPSGAVREKHWQDQREGDIRIELFN